MARIIDEKRRKEKNDALQKRTWEYLKNNEVCVFPSSDLKSLDQEPRIEILN